MRNRASVQKFEINLINDWIRLFHSRIENVKMGFSYFSYKNKKVLEFDVEKDDGIIIWRKKLA